MTPNQDMLDRMPEVDSETLAEALGIPVAKSLAERKLEADLRVLTTPTYVLRWRMFEWVWCPEKPLHEHRIEITLGEHIVDRVVGKSGAPRWFSLWAFDFKGVDAEGRRVYEATADPYESIVETVEQERLARYVLEHVEVEIEEGDEHARSSQED